jgi:hypothetical protein
MNLTIDLLRRQSRRGEVELDDAIPSFLPVPACGRSDRKSSVTADCSPTVLFLGAT